MAKITLENGVVIEGTIAELAELAQKFGDQPAEAKPEAVYVKVTGRKVKVGDYLKFTEVEAGVTVGKYYAITEVDEDGDYEFIDDAGDESVAIVEDGGFEIFEKAVVLNGKQYRNVGEVTAEKGDYVRFYNDHPRTQAGKFYEVIDDSEYYRADGGYEGYTTFGWDGRYEREVFRLVEKVVEVEPVSVGDYIVALPEANSEYTRTNTRMKLGKVVQGFIGSEDDLRIEVVAHSDEDVVGREYYVRSKFFRKATDEEVAEAMATEKWTKLGRKPNEFKKGDIVRVIDSPSAQPNGTIFEVERVNIDGDVFDGLDYVYFADKNRVELIAPVESRVDK